MLFWHRRTLEELKQTNEIQAAEIARLTLELSAAQDNCGELNKQLAETQVGLANQKEFNTLWLNSSEMITSIREGLAVSATGLIKHRDSFHDSIPLFDSILDLLTSTVDATTIINADTEQVSASIGSLKEVTEGINSFITLIQGISEQTNLLGCLRK